MVTIPPPFHSKHRLSLCKWERTIERFIKKAVLAMLFWAAACALLLVLFHFASNYQFQAVGIIALTPLALLLGLSGLMYNRARAIEAKRQKFRSVYAAERLMAAGYYYLIAIILGFIPTVFLQPFSEGKHLPSPDALVAMYCPLVLYCMRAFTEMCFGIVTACPVPRFRNVTQVARSTVRLLNH